jgi:long-chain acyl-CoA synthetase
VVNEYFARPQAAKLAGTTAEGGEAGPSARQAAKIRPREESGDGWLHTGDIAEMDAEGNLYYRGRKKEMIVRPDGLNVYPQDVEAVLNRCAEVRESVVVGVERNGEERIHAAVLLRKGMAGLPSQRLETAVRKANGQLEAHQRIQSWSLWPEEDFPRTASTMKIRRSAVAERIAAGGESAKPSVPASAVGIDSMLAEITGRDVGRLGDSHRLEADLGLSSLERVELMARVESHYNVELDEERFAAIATVGELRRWLHETESATSSRGESEAEPHASPRPDRDAPATPIEAQADARPAAVRGTQETPAPAFLVQPRWSRWFPVASLRAVLLELAILPMVRELVRLKVEGLEHLALLTAPVIFAANHTSHFDTAVIACALPRRWRRRLAPAMSQDFFRPLFEQRRFSPEQFWSSAGQFLLACGLFNAYPLPQKMGGARRALRYTGELVGRGYCPLVFPEGERSTTGRMMPFKSGIGLMARRLSVPVVPVHLQGLYDVYSVHHEWPKPGRVTVRFGSPLRFATGGDYLEAAQAVEHALRSLGQAAPPNENRSA